MIGTHTMRIRIIALAALLVAALCPLAAQAVTPFTIVALPDIQNETQFHPAMLQSQVDWIVASRSTQNIAFVAQQGDITNNATAAEFATAHNNLFQLSTNAPGMPWGVCGREPRRRQLPAVRPLLRPGELSRADLVRQLDRRP